MRERQFTLEEATAQLTWLEEIFALLASLQDDLSRQHSVLQDMIRQTGGNGAASQDKDIREAQQVAEGLTSQMRQHLREITERGIIVRDIARGLVDFSSSREGRDIFLCWVRGEDKIAYWHGTNEGFASRKLL